MCIRDRYFADRGVFCAGRLPEEDLNRVAKATGARTQTTVNNLDVSGACWATFRVVLVCVDHTCVCDTRCVVCSARDVWFL